MSTVVSNAGEPIRATHTRARARTHTQRDSVQGRPAPAARGSPAPAPAAMHLGVSLFSLASHTVAPMHPTRRKLRTIGFATFATANGS